jgi:hypothetical protein
VSNGTTLPSDDDRIAALASYEGSFSEMEKLALETMARTARPALDAFELSMSMMRLRARLRAERAKLGNK